MRDGVGDFAHAVHQPRDAVQHVVDDAGEFVEFVAVAGFRHALCQIAAGDGARGGGDVADHAPEQRANDEGADDAQHRHDAHGPEQPGLQHAPQFGARPHVPADQQLVAVLQIIRPQQRDRCGPLPRHRQFVPGIRHAQPGRPLVEVADQMVALRVQQQVDRVAIDIIRQPALDRRGQ